MLDVTSTPAKQMLLLAARGMKQSVNAKPMTNTARIGLLIVDDHPIVREGLKSLCEAASDIEVAGIAQSGEEALRKAKRLRPDVVLLDIAMPAMHGIETARRLAEVVPTSKVLMLSSYSETEEIVRAVEAGAAGYLMKETAANEVLQAVREVHRGNIYFSAEISQRIARQNRETFGRVGRQKVSAPRLTTRESQVLTLIAAGKANKQIADELGISIKTVEKHRGSLMEKLNLHEAASLTRYAITSGAVASYRPALAKVA
jgi:DNA-binding NarL/FixJ family response regulator